MISSVRISLLRLPAHRIHFPYPPSSSLERTPWHDRSSIVVPSPTNVALEFYPPSITLTLPFFGLATSEPAPSGTFIATTTGVGGVPQATRPLSNPNSSNPNSSGALPVHPMWGWSTVLPGTITLVFFFWTVMVS